MKKVLVVGANSYIGTSFEKWLMKNPDSYQVDTVGTMKDEWKRIDFKGYDSILHVAGIAHVSADPKMEDLYYKINRDLAVEVANKAKEDGVGQFIFMSSIIIYGKDGGICKKRVVAKDTQYAPVDFYGRSKLEADLAIQKMISDTFNAVIIRTPVVYGPGCKGNYPKLIKLAKSTPIFPDIKNERSMIYIDNLCEFLKLCLDNDIKGVFYPQNKEYVSTTQIIRIAAELMGKKVWCTKFFNGLIKLIGKKNDYINKVFGNKVYDKPISDEFNWDYDLIDFEESIRNSM